MSEMSNKQKNRKQTPHVEGVLELVGIETREEAKQIKKLGEAWLVPRLTWEQTLGLAPIKGLG